MKYHLSKITGEHQGHNITYDVKAIVCYDILGIRNGAVVYDPETEEMIDALDGSIFCNTCGEEITGESINAAPYFDMEPK